MRPPVRTALPAGSVTPETYGRAFGFERMMDMLGAIVGPATAFVLLPWVGHHYPTLLALTLIPGLLAVAAITLLVRERERKPAPHISCGTRLRAMPPRLRMYSQGKARPTISARVADTTPCLRGEKLAKSGHEQSAKYAAAGGARTVDQAL